MVMFINVYTANLCQFKRWAHFVLSLSHLNHEGKNCKISLGILI